MFNGASQSFLRCDDYIVVGTAMPQVDYLNLTNCSLVKETSGTNLLSNGSFEAKDGDRKPELSPWVLKNRQHDKVICDKDPTIAFKGACAFRFKNKGSKTSAKLTQSVDFTNSDTKVGDTLRFSFSYNFAEPQAELKVKCVVNYADQQQPQSKTKRILVQTAGYQGFIENIVLAYEDVSQANIILIHKSQEGKGYIDLTRLEVIKSEIPKLLPLP